MFYDCLLYTSSPKEAAHDVLTTLLDKKINEENSNKNNRQVLQIAIIALLAAPIGIPVGIGLLMAIIGIFIAAVSVLLAFFAVSAAGLTVSYTHLSSPQAVPKADVIRQALATHNLAPENVVLIGDTKFDMIGAQETGIKKLAVTWGFGDEKELMSYQPEWVAHQPRDILRQLQ